ncbi:MAG TPA: COX15/CtaA family protein [Acidimicrobiales bacterium]
MPNVRGWSTRQLAPSTYRRITTLALASLAIIVVTGAAVRLTGSGLGCSDWPGCHEDRFVPEGEFHESVEYLNRMFTGAVSVAVILAVLGSRWRRPYRRDLARWSWGLVAGVVGQIVLGGLVVIFELSPWLVIGHFVLSIVLVWNAVVLRHRAGHDGRGGIPVVSPRTLQLGRVLVLGATAAVLTGTLVTGSGPHGGDEEVERLPFLIHTVVRVHGVTVMVLLALVLLAGWWMHRDGATRAIWRRYQVLLAVLVAQAGVGYAQYFTDVPPLLVGIHVAGATAVWISVLSFHLGLFAWRPEPSSATTEARARATTEAVVVTP